MDLSSVEIKAKNRNENRIKQENEFFIFTEMSEAQTKGPTYPLPWIAVNQTRTFTFSDDLYKRMHEIDDFCKLMNERGKQINARTLKIEPELEFFSDSEEFDAWFCF
jgi:hypothetical protein